VPALFPFIDCYRSLYQGQIRRPTKVALIDNGILNVSPKRPEDITQGEQTRAKGDISGRIMGGESFVHKDGGKISPWFIASDPHGTQMANLICAIDPLCELYIAKVGEGRFDMATGRMIQVSIGGFNR
jgi:hypothetical protein